MKKSAIDPRFETSDLDFEPEHETNDIATLLRQQIKNQKTINDKLDKIIQILEKQSPKALPFSLFYLSSKYFGHSYSDKDS